MFCLDRVSYFRLHYKIHRNVQTHIVSDSGVWRGRMFAFNVERTLIIMLLEHHWI
jgi:hypothetical protein